MKNLLKNLDLEKLNSSSKVVVSVVTVVLNNGNFLKKSLQKYREIFRKSESELIIIDGGSIDNTLDVIKDNSDIITYWVSEIDNGIYDAMNKGILNSKGKYIILVNSDDSVEPEIFDEMIHYAAQCNADIIACAAKMTRNGKQAFIRWPRKLDIGLFVRPIPFSHNSIFISRNLYARIGLYRTDYKIVSDLDFYYRAFFAKASVEIINKVLITSELTGFSGTQTELLEQENISVLQDYFPFMSRQEISVLTDIRSVIAGKDIDINFKLLLDLIKRSAGVDDNLSTMIKVALDENPTLFIGESYEEILKLLPRNPKFRNEFQPFTPLENDEDIPLITIGITAHNCQETLKIAVDSVLRQTWQKIEIVIVDDGSSDKTKKILEEMQSDRVKVFYNIRIYGVASARNHIISRARGKYIMFCDDDDYSLPNRVEVCLNQIKKIEKQLNSENVICFCSRDVITLQNQKIYVQAAGVECPIVGKNIDKLIYGNLIRVAGIQGTLGEMDVSVPRAVGAGVGMYPTKLLRELGFHESFHRLEDLEFCLAASSVPYSAIITGVKTPLYVQKMTVSSDKSKEITSIFSILLITLYYKKLSNYEISVYEVLKQYTAMIGLRKQQSVKALIARTRLLSETNNDKNSNLSNVNNFNIKPCTELKVGVFNTFDRGGAGMGSIRRVKALREHGIDATLHPLVSTSSWDFVKPLVVRQQQEATWEKAHQHSILPAKNEPGYCSMEMFSLPYSVIDYRKYTELLSTLDILHLHWVVGIFDYENAGEVLGEKPVVWTLADMNAFTGGCHYSQGCEGYQRECESCHLLGGNSNLAHESWKIKQLAYSQIKNLEIICPSVWLAEKVKKSSLLGSRKIHVIPNAYPINDFTPVNKVAARIKLNLPLDKKLVLFGADSLSNLRKGGDLLADALKVLKEISPIYEKIEVVTYGKNSIDLPLFTHFLGFLKRSEQLKLAYSACDVYVFPSREDNAPLTVGESLLCGTPVVAFPVGNVLELITHRKNGYIASYGNISDLAEGIRWVIETINHKDLLKMSINCRLVAANYHSPTTAAERHISIYRKMLG